MAYLTEAARRRVRRSRARIGVGAVVAVALASVVAAPAVADAVAALVSHSPRTVMATTKISSGRSGMGRAARGTHARAETRRIIPSIRVNLVGASWSGQTQSIRLRARGVDHRWSRWVTLHAEPDEGPDATSAERRHQPARHVVPVPTWVGDATLLEVRATSGSLPRGLSVTTLNTTGTAHASDRLRTGLRDAAARVLGTSGGATASGTPATPTIITRAQWGADESIRRAAPAYASGITAAVVHHTDNANSYSAAQSAALVRGIYAYHVQSNGWNDIGYNYLIDRYGQIFEGRYGGTTKAVIGAHTMGFNTNTTGVSLIGTFSTVSPPSAMQTSLRKLLSWRLDLDHVDPTGTTKLVSRGNPTYASGTAVTVRAISGHRDLYPTDCPGRVAYSLINSVRTAVWAQDGAKIGRVVATPTVGSTGNAAGLDVSARGNMPLVWTLRIARRSDDQTMYTTTTTSASTFHVNADVQTALGGVPATDVRWTLSGTASATGSSARPVVREFINVPPPVTMRARLTGGTWVTPNGDGVSDGLLAAAVTTQRSTVSAAIVSVIDHTTVVGTVLTPRVRPAGTTKLTWAGLADATGVPVPDGAYELRVTARDQVAGRADVVKLLPVYVDTSVTWKRVPAVMSPGVAGKRAAIVTRVTTTPTTIPVTLILRRTDRPGTSVTLIAPAPTGGGTATITGATPDGVYALELTAPVTAGTLALSQPLRIDRHAPVGTIRRMGKRVRIRVSEPVTIIARVRAAGSRRMVTRVVKVGRGVTVTRRLRGATKVTLIDAAGLRTRLRVRT